MPKSKQQKTEVLESLKSKLSKSKTVIFAAFNALGVKDNEELRLKLKAENGEYYVAKKTLLDLALNISDFKAKSLPGKVATVFAYEDEVAPAKALFTFKKGKEDKIQFLGGILNGKLLSQAEVESLAQLPSKPELYAKLVGSMNAPISGFVNVLAGNLRGLVRVLKAIEGTKIN